MTIRTSETKIAMIAPFRICRLKLAETFLTPTEVGAQVGRRAAAERSVCSCSPSDSRPHLELLVGAVRRPGRGPG